MSISPSWSLQIRHSIHLHCLYCIICILMLMCLCIVVIIVQDVSKVLWMYPSTCLLLYVGLQRVLTYRIQIPCICNLANENSYDSNSMIFHHQMTKMTAKTDNGAHLPSTFSCVCIFLQKLYNFESYCLLYSFRLFHLYLVSCSSEIATQIPRALTCFFAELFFYLRVVKTNVD